ncbi:MAG: thymidine phosphorylase family protein [Gammaproteobacteria bacterium]|nr:thymidine phosphorylase family protein [Gammaproteobacteria bacterium]
MSDQPHPLTLKRLGVGTYKEAVIYMREDCHVCRSEGFEVQTRIHVKLGGRSILATLNTIDSNLLTLDEASLSNYAWEYLQAKEGDEVFLSHPTPLRSLSFIHTKIYGHSLDGESLDIIIKDVIEGRLSDIQIASFLTACAGGRLSQSEIIELTKTMVKVGDRLQWPSECIVDKHCIGGLPGNRTTLIVVPIVAAFGLTIPKTSSRAITSPAGTADTMEVLAPVNLDLSLMGKVVEKENGCIVWGGAVSLSPADDILIRVERAIDLDSEGQLIASVLSKKIAAGSTHAVIDIPIGPTAKVRTLKTAELLKNYLELIGKTLGITIRAIFTDGSQPVGRGIGPALEAKDVLAVLNGEKNAPKDLRECALTLAGAVLEFSPKVEKGQGQQIAQTLLDSGKAWQKFQAICLAQGGMFEPPKAAYTHVISSNKAGKVNAIDNRRIARIAKLAGAPKSKAAGVELHVKVDEIINRNQPLFTLHSETKAELDYALTFFREENEIIQLEPV